MNNIGSKVIKRMNHKGDYIVRGTGGHFWANTSHRGCLIEAASNEEVACIQKLAREGRGGVVHETKSRRYG